jgi:bifunctional DNA-binding transcriptional regulator/antitoxin component of YhaV-PrlF toxin-antitoxin module
MKVLTSSKVAKNGMGPNGRICLSRDVLKTLGLDIGDFVAIVQDGDRFLIQKVAADAE